MFYMYTLTISPLVMKRPAFKNKTEVKDCFSKGVLEKCLGQVMQSDNVETYQNAIHRNAKSFKLGQLMKSDNIHNRQSAIDCYVNLIKLDQVMKSDNIKHRPNAMNRKAKSIKLG